MYLSVILCYKLYKPFPVCKVGFIFILNLSFKVTKKEVFMGEFVSKLFRSKKFQMFLVVLCIVLMPALGIIFINI